KPRWRRRPEAPKNETTCRVASQRAGGKPSGAHATHPSVFEACCRLLRSRFELLRNLVQHFDIGRDTPRLDRASDRNAIIRALVGTLNNRPRLQVSLTGGCLACLQTWRCAA